MNSNQLLDAVLIMVFILIAILIFLWVMDGPAPSIPKFLRKKKPLPVYCNIHGCKYEETVEYGNVRFSPITGKAYRFNRILTSCPNYALGSSYPYKFCDIYIIKENIREELPELQGTCDEENILKEKLEYFRLRDNE